MISKSSCGATRPLQEACSQKRAEQPYPSHGGQVLWLQSTLAKGQLEWKKVSTCDNPADILTKPTSREGLRRRLALVGGELHEAVKNGGNVSDVPRIVPSLAG